MNAKKIDVIFVVDCSDKLKSEKNLVENTINACVRLLKRKPDLYGFDFSLSLVPFSDDIHKDNGIEFKPLKEIYQGLDLGSFGGSSNPGPAILDITVKALQRYDNWRAEGYQCYHPMVIFISDGLHDLEKVYQSAYEKVAKFIKDRESCHILNIYPFVVDGSSVDNVNLLTNYPERVLKASDLTGFDEKFAEIIDEMLGLGCDFCNCVNRPIDPEIFEKMFGRFFDED